jgi:hypothetical protein
MEYKDKFNVDIDDKGSHFLIRCPMWANDLVRQIPSRRWNKSAGAWAAPIIRQNVVAMEEVVKMAGVVVTDRAREAMATYVERDATVLKQRGVGFPSWYPFKTTPRKHQVTALDKGYGLNAYFLAMDMQTGKTKTVIDLLSAHRMEGHVYGALVFTKLSLRGNWKLQFETHCPIDYSMHLPTTDKIKDFERWLAKPHDFKVMVVGWESMSAGGMKALCERFLLSLNRSATVGDETSYIAGHKAVRSQEVVRLGTMSEYKYAMNGTPDSCAGPMNLFMQFEFLDPNIIGIGDYYTYRNRYAIMGGYTPKEGPMRGKPMEVVGYQNMDELMGLIGPHMFQVLKTDAYDLPPKRYQIRTVPMSKKQADLYKQVKKEGFLTTASGEEMVMQNTLEVVLRLHQIAGGYTVNPRQEIRKAKDGTDKIKIHYDPIEVIPPEENPKMQEVFEFVRSTKKQGIIWAVYRPEIEAMVRVLKGMGIRVGELHGGIGEANRQPMVDAFKRGDIDWVVANAATGGMGYTMMASQINIFYNNTHKAIDRVQAEDRAWGDGQDKQGIWIDIIAEKTVDVLIYKSNEAKQDLSTYMRSRIKDVTRLLDGDID